jgi:hypothetical protein
MHTRTRLRADAPATIPKHVPELSKLGTRFVSPRGDWIDRAVLHAIENILHTHTPVWFSFSDSLASFIFADDNADYRAVSSQILFISEMKKACEFCSFAGSHASSTHQECPRPRGRTMSLPLCRLSFNAGTYKTARLLLSLAQHANINQLL